MDMRQFADRSWHFAALLGPSHIARKKKKKLSHEAKMA